MARFGEDNPAAKLTNRQVKRIKERLARGEHWYSVAKDYDHVVTRPNIYHIWMQYTWGWL